MQTAIKSSKDCMLSEEGHSSVGEIVSYFAMINRSKAAKRRFNSFAFFRSPRGYLLGIWLSWQEVIGTGGWNRFRMFLKWQEKPDQERLHFPGPTVGNIQLGYFYASSRRHQNGTLILFFVSYQIFMASSCSLKQRIVQLDKPRFQNSTCLENRTSRNLSRALQNLLLAPSRERRFPISAPFIKSHLPQFQFKKPLPKLRTLKLTTTNTKNFTEQVIRLSMIYRHSSQPFADPLSLRTLSSGNLL